jgi:protein SCO1/2
MLGLIPVLALGHGGSHDETAASRLPVIGSAPDFTLADQDGVQVSIGKLRGRPVVLSFIYTSCRDVCHLLTARLVEVQAEIGRRFGSKVMFLSITVDPETDTPSVLRDYAVNQGVQPVNWRFLTGTRAVIEGIAHGYGVAVRRVSDRDVDHTLLTSMIDKQGRLRVQYLGSRFDIAEFIDDLAGLIAAP